jgi:hypothetical protein
VRLIENHAIYQKGGVQLLILAIDTNKGCTIKGLVVIWRSKRVRKHLRIAKKLA